jgi:type II secretory pathway component GspD/PulD (secretin)
VGKKALATALCVVAGEVLLAGGCTGTPTAPDGAADARPAVGAQDVEAELETRAFQLAYIGSESSRYRTRTRSEVGSPEPVEITAASGRRSLVRLLESIKSERGAVADVQAANALVVTDVPGKLDAMAKLISQLDKQPKQVHFSVKVVVFSDADAESVRRELLPDADQGASQGPRRGYRLACLDFAGTTAFLASLTERTQCRVMQAPQFIVLDCEEAVVPVGDLFRYFHGSAYEGAFVSKWAPEGSPADLDIQILVTPQVTPPDSGAILTVIPEREFEVFDGGPLGELKLPQADPGGTVTIMMVADRRTAVVSGLRGEWQGETVNVLVLITPTVIDFETRADAPAKAGSPRP